ncbi:sugar ABC transporter permease [Oscillospiraceae bacterium HV4-5-C5C]|nr:sugar ABC transporter permease [Oscillospiraceae bacterium HV4-5-C5C]
MILPGFIYLLINNYIPMAGLIIAFKDVNFAKGILKSDWVGFKNFEYLFKTPDAFRITRNTLLYNLAFIAVNLIIGVMFAVLLSEIHSKKAVKFYQTVVLLPYMISMVIVSYLTYAFLSSNTGLINGFLKTVGLPEVSWYTEQAYWPFILIFVNCWKYVGYGTVVYLASILGIDRTLYEAAAVDGITKMQEIFKITIPLIKPTIITMVLLSVGRIFYSDFGLFYQVPMNSGALLNTTNTIDTYVYRGLITLGDIGMASAAGFYQSIVGFFLILAANALTRRYSSENALF